MALTQQVCHPWADLDELPSPRPFEQDAEAWTELLLAASELLYAFSGRQFSGGCESSVVLTGPAHGHQGVRWTPMGEAAAATTGVRPTRWVREPVVVVLPGPPVTRVDSVTIAGAPVEVTVRLPYGRLERPSGAGWPLDGSVAVRYRHGIPPPVGGRDAAVQLAMELGRARDGADDCALPQRITQVTREGVTVGLMDTFDNLDKLRTGLLEVDMWLASVNPNRLTRRPSVWSPDLARTRRTRS